MSSDSEPHNGAEGPYSPEAVASANARLRAALRAGLHLHYSWRAGKKDRGYVYWVLMSTRTRLCGTDRCHRD